MREWVGKCKIEWPARLIVRSLRYCCFYFIVERPTLHEYAVTRRKNNALLPGKSQARRLAKKQKYFG